MSLGLYKFIQY